MAVYTDAIQKLYVAYFNRPADYEGLAFWEKVLTANGGDVTVVSRAHAASPEYKDQVAGKTNFQIINQIYNNLFNRDADVEGMQFWADRLTEGTFTVDQIVKVIAESASDTDAKDATTYKNKVAAATAFTAELNNATEIIGYTGDKANAAAKAWLSTVTTDASLKAAIEPAALASTVADVVHASIPETQFSLTEGVDTYTGTFGNDVVTASASGEKSTLAAGDTLDGNAGNDTLNLEVGAGINSDLSKVTIKNFETVNITGSDNLGLSAADAGKLAALASAKAAKDASAATLAAASTTATTLQGRLDTAEANVTAAESAVSDAEGDVATAEGAVTTAEGNVTTAEAAVTTRQGELTTANQLRDAAAYVATLATEADIDIAAAATVAPTGAIYTAAQLRAAASAARTAADGSSLATAGDDSVAMTARADALAASAASAATTAQGNLVTAQGNLTTAQGNLVTAEGNLTAAQGVLATANTDLTTAKSLEIAAQAAFDAAKTQVAAAATADVAAQTALTNAETAAATVVTSATVSTASFAGVTAISVDGVKTTVTGLNSHTVTLNAGDAGAVNNTLKYASAATAANIVLDGTSGAITLADNSVTTKTAGLATVNLSGSSFIAKGAEKGSIALTDNTNANAGAVKTLKATLSNDTIINVDGLKKLTTVDAVASTGGITIMAGNPLTASTLTSVTTGTGDDVVMVAVKTTAAAGTTAAKNLTVSTGAGDDEINVYNIAGSTGLTTVNAGAGDDKITVTKATGAGLNISGGAGNDVITLRGDALATTDVIDGGEGTDTIAMAGSTASRTADDFIVFNKLVKNFETIKFTTAEGYAANGSTPAVALDASKLGANYTTIDLASNSFVANVGTQAIIANGNVDVTATGYSVASNGTVTFGSGVLNITETVSGTVTAKADTVNLAVKASEESGVDAVLAGNVKTASITLTNAVTEGTATVDPVDTFAGVTVTSNNAGLKSLASLTLKGTGSAVVNNSIGSTGATTDSALVNIDASGLSNALTVGDDAGDILAGLRYTSGNTKAETIKLSAGIDTVTLGASTYGAVDTVTGLNLVLSTDGKSIGATSDKLFINGVSGATVVTKMTTTQTDLDLALKDASVLKYAPTGSTTATAEADLVIFAMGGDTYVYNDTNHSNSVDATDIVVKLTGTIDLDALSLMLKALPN